MIRYVFRDDPVLIKNAKEADPQKIGEALATISERNGGRLTPAATVAAARPRGAELHPFFEWRDKVAAEAHRLDQARQIIRSIRVVDDDDDVAEPKMAWLSVADAPKGFAYVSRSAVETSVHLQTLVLTQAERDLAAWERRYSELAQLCPEIREMRERIADRRRRLLDDGRGARAGL